VQSEASSSTLNSRFNRGGILHARQWIHHYGGKTVFLLGLIIYLVVQLRLVLIPILNRSVPVEADDAYTYIIKAAEMESCFLQDCPALADLRKQLAEPSSDEQVIWLRYREYTRAFVVYHPLHSLLLAGLDKAGFTWESAYNVITVSGVIFISLAIGYLLYVLWGPVVAGIALAGLSISLFPGQGLHYIVPSNLSLGIAIFTWAVVIHKKERARWFMLAGILAMISMHTNGRLYALITEALFWLVTGGQLPWRMPRKSLIAASLGLLLVVLSFALPLVIQRPDLLVKADPLPPAWQPRQGLINNLTAAGVIVTAWGAAFGSLLVAGLLVGAGLYFTPRHRLKPVLSLLVLLVAVAAATLFYVLPRYPAEAFGRIWVPLAILLTGLIAQAFVGWISALSSSLLAVVQHRTTPIFRGRWILSRQGWALVGMVALGVAFLSAAFIYVPSGTSAVSQTSEIMTNKQNISLDPSQPALLLSKDCGKVLYMDEVPMHFYLTRGALRCGAIYYPPLAKTPYENPWVKNNKKIRYLVAWNPSVIRGTNTGGSTRVLTAGDQLTIRNLASRRLDSIWISFDNPGPEVTLTAKATDSSLPEATDIQLKVPARSSSSVKITDQAGITATDITLAMPEDSQLIRIEGIRVDPLSNLNWPWDTGISLDYQPANPLVLPTTITFNSNDLAPTLGRPIHVLADNGDTVLAEVGN
jgi:hypothetical protein